MAPVIPVDAELQVSDGELVGRARAGDAWARSALLARYVGTTANAVARLLGDPTEAEDVVHDAVVEALEGLGKLREPEAFRGWLMRIAIGKVHRRFRRNRLLAVLGLRARDQDASLAGQAAPGTDVETREELRRLDAALATLAPAVRLAWMLRHVEGMALDEVAAALGCSLATVKRRIARGETIVRAYVERARAEAQDDG